jgi:hypothetical protein
LITVLQSRPNDVLHGIPKGATYEETLQALEDRFGDQEFSATYRRQVRTQRAGEFLQKFVTVIEQLAHPTLHEKHVSREAGKAFADGVEDTDIKILALLGGEKMAYEVLR